MSLLLDALDRAERERREQAARGRTELSLEPTEPSAETQPSIPTLSPGDARSLFNLDQRVPVHRRTLIWGIGTALVGVGAAVLVWILTLQPAEVPPTQASRPSSPVGVPRPVGLAGASDATQPAAGAGIPAAGTGSNGAAGAVPSASVAHTPNQTARRNASEPGSGPHGVAMLAPETGARARSTTPVLSGQRSTVALAGDPIHLFNEPTDRTSSSAASGAGTGPGLAATPSHPTSQKTVNAPSVDIRLFRSPEPTQVDPALLAAWQDLRDGRLTQAQVAYQKLEQTQPTSVDVQLGLARLAAEQGRRAEARQHYQHALLLDPQNSTARAGLAVMEPANDGSPVDSQLRANAADPLAQAALGARLGAAGQWPEAEQAWFEALRGDPENPDLLFNLGVALDHLGQTASAVRHYRDALQAAGKQRAHFDPHSVEQRLHALAAD